MAWVVHKSESEWGRDATEFKPDRWLQPGQEALGGARSAHSNLNFSASPRSCIGEGFAKAEALAMMAVLVGPFEFELAEQFDKEAEDLDLLWAVTVKSVAMRLRVKVVEGW
jgi:cytochrome P450